MQQILRIQKRRLTKVAGGHQVCAVKGQQQGDGGRLQRGETGVAADEGAPKGVR